MYRCYYCGTTLYTYFNNPSTKKNLMLLGIEENWYPSYFEKKIFICKQCNKNRYEQNRGEKHKNVYNEMNKFKQALDEEFTMEFCCLCDNRSEALHHENYDFWNHFYFICRKCHSAIHFNEKNLTFINNKDFSPNTDNEELLIHHRKNLEYLKSKLKNDNESD